MNALKLVILTLVNLVKQACLLPEAALGAFRQRRHQAARRLFEVERLDRIRNPSKYLGR